MNILKIDRRKLSKTIETEWKPKIEAATKRSFSNNCACWGIQNSELAKIMGVLNYGDSGHSFLNTKTGSTFRNLVSLGVVDNEGRIPARPWLDATMFGANKKYFNKAVKEAIQEFFDSTKNFSVDRTEKNARRFYDKVAQKMAEITRDIYEESEAFFEPNALATEEKKLRTGGDLRVLHDTGRMNDGQITGWVE